VVRADIQAPNPVLDGPPGREHQHGGPLAGSAKALAHLEPIHVGKQDVEHDRFEVGLSGDPERLVASRGHLDHVSLLLQAALQQAGHLHGVLHHQYPHAVSPGTLPTYKSRTNWTAGRWVARRVPKIAATTATTVTNITTAR